MKNKDFEKARVKKLENGLIGLSYSIILFLITYLIYVSGNSLLDILFGVMGMGLFIVSFIDIITYIESKTNPERYSLCKRCKGLIKKDKIFCSDCKNSIRISIKRDKDKKYFNEYKTLIKKEEKKR